MIKYNDIWGICSQSVLSRQDAYNKADISFLILSVSKDPGNNIFQIESMLIKDRTGTFLPGQSISFSNGALSDFFKKYNLIYRENYIKSSSLTNFVSVNKNGLTCKVCKELYPYAEPNQYDGTLICYSCRV